MDLGWWGEVDVPAAVTFLAAREEIDDARIGVVGLSMGGRIAQDFYALYPRHVASLTIVASFTGFQNFSDADRQKFLSLRLVQ